MNELFLGVQFIKNSEIIFSNTIPLPNVVQEDFISDRWENKEYQINALRKNEDFYSAILEIASRAFSQSCNLRFNVFQVQNGEKLTNPKLLRDWQMRIGDNEKTVHLFFDNTLIAYIINSLTYLKYYRSQKNALLEQINIGEQSPIAAPEEITIIDGAPPTSNELDISKQQPPSSFDVLEEQCHIESSVRGEDDSKITERIEKTIKEVSEEVEEAAKKSEPTPLRSKTLKKIYMREEALNLAKRHAYIDRDMETGGVLLGRILAEKGDAISVLVTGIIRALHTNRSFASLEFTDVAWAQIWRAIDNDPIYSDEKQWMMLGWYHTHPSFGIFLSSYDLFIHRKFFNKPEHIALVIDPIKDKFGFFGWEAGQVIAYKQWEIINDKKIIEILGYKDSLPLPEIKEAIRKEMP